MWRVLGVHRVSYFSSSWLIFLCYRDQIIKSITTYQSIMWLFPVPYMKEVFFYCVFWKFEIQIICMHSSMCSLTAKRSWQRLHQAEAQQTRFVQWVLICRDRNSEKLGTRSAAELNVFFSLTHFSWENQIEMIAVDDYMLYSFLVLRTWCIDFFLRHLREKNNFAMQMVSKNAEDTKLQI